MNNYIKLKDVLLRYKEGTCTVEEVTWLHSQLQNPAVGDEIEQLISDGLLDDIPQLEQPSAAMRQKLDSLYTSIARRAMIAPAIKVKPKRAVPAWLAAAATIVIAIGITWFIQRRPDNATQQQQTTAAIKPGEDKAVLTLANGRTIPLNGAKGAVLMANHKLAYADGSSILPEGTQTNYYTISTPKGGQYRVTLDDGTQVWLNAASTLKYPAQFTGTQRMVEFEGEGYFEVAKSVNKGKNIPFRVKTHNQVVEVLGTGFNINNYTDENEATTTLLHGSVRVTALNSGSSALLKPDQQSLISTNNTGVEVSDVDAQNAIAWKNGYFKFENADIYTVMKQLARWYDIEVVFEKNVPEVNFSGKIKRGESFQKVTEHFDYFGLKFKLNGNRVTVGKK